MRNILKRHFMPIQAYFDFSLVLTYAFPQKLLLPLLAPGLSLDTYEGLGFLAIAMVQTRELRPAFLPRAVGQRFFLTGYRIFARYQIASGRWLRGLHILRSDTDHTSMVLLGNLLTHYGYDRSPLYRWTWIKSQFVKIPQQIVNIHAGFDESSGAIHDLFPQAKLVILDFYDPERMTEPSIARARRHRPARLTSRPIDAETIPLANSSCDAVFLLFAAHEIRNAQERLRFFREVSRIVSPGGTVLIVEHRRDLVNFLAFGPGFLHFYPQAEWLRLAAECNLRVACNYSMTPFVGVLVLNKGENT